MLKFIILALFKVSILATLNQLSFRFIPKSFQNNFQSGIQKGSRHKRSDE